MREVVFIKENFNASQKHLFLQKLEMVHCDRKRPRLQTKSQMGTRLAGFTCPSLQPPKRDDRKLKLDLHLQKEMLRMEEP